MATNPEDFPVFGLDWSVWVPRVVSYNPATQTATVARTEDAMDKHWCWRCQVVRVRVFGGLCDGCKSSVGDKISPATAPQAEYRGEVPAYAPQPATAVVDVHDLMSCTCKGDERCPSCGPALDACHPTAKFRELEIFDMDMDKCSGDCDHPAAGFVLYSTGHKIPKCADCLKEAVPVGCGVTASFHKYSEKEALAASERCSLRENVYSCARDGIDAGWNCDKTKIEAGVPFGDEGYLSLWAWVDADPNPCNWYDQALQLVARVSRLRDLLRQAGEKL